MTDEVEVVETPQESEQDVGQEVSVDASHDEPAAAEQDSETADSTGEAAAPDGEIATAKPKNRVQERINELTRQRHEKERALDEAKQEAEYWKKQATQSKPEQQPQPQSGKPQWDQYDSNEEYLEALSNYQLDQRLSAREAEQAQKAQQQKAAELQRTFMERAEKLEVEDFVDVVYNPDLQISPEMTRLAFESEKGPEILYHLGQNPAEAARIAAMDAAQAGRAIGMLEAQLSLPKAKTITSAPPPIKPISGTGEPPTIDQEKMTPEQWRDWRNEQLRQQGAH